MGVERKNVHQGRDYLLTREIKMILMHRFIRITDDEVHNLMNIETVIPNDKESHVRVLISYPNSRIVVKESFDKLTSSLIKNPTLKNWSTCAIILFTKR